MHGSQLALSISAAIGAIIALAGIAAYAFLRASGDQPAPRYQPRHHHAAAEAGERTATTGELAAWREDWTDTELAALRGETPLPLPPEPGWSLHRWQAEQESWLEARRREAHEQQLLLRARVWADPWWIR